MKTIKQSVADFKVKTKWAKLVKSGMKCDFSWEESAKEYIELYEKKLKK
jgi:starch synthase